MTFITEKIRAAVTTAAAAERPLIDLKWTWIATVAICAFFIGVREYEQMFGWKAGMELRTLASFRHTGCRSSMSWERSN